MPNPVSPFKGELKVKFARLGFCGSCLGRLVGEQQDHEMLRTRNRCRRKVLFKSYEFAYKRDMNVSAKFDEGHSRSEHKGPAWEQSLDFLWLEITARCNLHCVHCYAESGPKESLRGDMTVADWKRVILEGFEAGCRRVQFIGGEPTLHPELVHLIEVARVTGYQFVEVYTNGTLLTDEMFAAFARNRVNLAFSVYSFSPHSHDRITKRTGSQEKTMNGIKEALRHGLDVRVGIIELPENLGETAETVRLLRDLGVNDIGVDRKREIGRGGIDSTDTNTRSQLCGQCWKGKLAVDSGGNVFPCVFSKCEQMGQAHEGISAILAKEELRKFRADVRQMHVLSAEAICSPNDDDACQPDDQKSCGPYTGCNPDYCSPNQRHCNPDNCTPSK